MEKQEIKQDRPEQQDREQPEAGVKLEDSALENIAGGQNDFAEFPRVPEQRVDYKLRRKG